VTQSRYRLSRRAAMTLLAAGALGTRGRRSLAASIGKPEKPGLKIGAPVVGATFLPLYIAADRSWKEQGLEAELVSFRSDSESAQALAGGSIDIAVLSGDGLVNLITSGQPCIGFYAGFHHADFSWLSQNAVTRWQDLKGSSVGVTGFGSLTDALTRYVLAKEGLAPERDVQIVPVGPGASGLQALRSGRVGAAILAPPYNAMAGSAGLHVLGTQRRDVAPEWPRELFVTSRAFLDGNPNTVQAVLRAHVSALRLARSDRAAAVAALVSWMKLAPDVADAAYDEIMPAYDERGRLPERSMAVFWDVARANGRLGERLPDRVLLDPRFVDSFDSWAP
jgi:NitT/TauT family transport system substrate-binding protein